MHFVQSKNHNIHRVSVTSVRNSDCTACIKINRNILAHHCNPNLFPFLLQLWRQQANWSISRERERPGRSRCPVSPAGLLVIPAPSPLCFIAGPAEPQPLSPRRGRVRSASTPHRRPFLRQLLLRGAIPFPKRLSQGSPCPRRFPRAEAAQGGCAGDSRAAKGGPAAAGALPSLSRASPLLARGAMPAGRCGSPARLAAAAQSHEGVLRQGACADQPAS